MKIENKRSWLNMSSLAASPQGNLATSSQSYSQIRTIEDLEREAAVDKAKTLFVIEETEEPPSSSEAIPLIVDPQSKLRVTIMAWMSVLLAMLAGASIGPVCNLLFQTLTLQLN